MSKSEKRIQAETLVALSALPDTLVYRNNTGSAWAGKRVEARVGSSITVQKGMTILIDAQPIKFGLPGSADIMGSMQSCALAVEIKDKDGRQQESQKNFERAWHRAGGIYVLARSADEAVDLVQDGVTKRLIDRIIG